MDIQEITRRVEKESLVLRQIMEGIGKVIVGQRNLIERMLIGLLCDGHLLLEGLPGLAKTTAVKTLAATINTTFQRIQFTPDLLPADILGTQFYRPDTATFEIKKGPIFHNIILADEINRAPAKVQSALLEAMQEHQITIGETTFPLARPFLVLATQNPIEQEGTYPDLSTSRGPDRPFYAQDQGRLPFGRGRKGDYGEGLWWGGRGYRRCSGCGSNPIRQRDHECDPYGGADHGLHCAAYQGYPKPKGI